MAQTKTAEVHGWHFHKLQVLLIVTAIVLLATGGTLFGLSQTVWKSIQNIPNPLPNQQVILPAPTETAKVTPTPVPTTTQPTRTKTIPIFKTEWTSNGPDTRNPNPGPNTPLNHSISEIVVDPIDPEIIYVISNTGPYLSLVWKSTDGGNNWSFLGERLWKAPGVYEGVMVPESRSLSQDKAVAPTNWVVYQNQICETLYNRLDKSDGRPVSPLGLQAAARDGNMLSLGLVAPLAGTTEIIRINPDGTKIVEPYQGTNGRYPFRLLLSPDREESWIEITPPSLAPVSGLQTMAIVAGKENVTLYIGGSEGKVWKTEIPLSKLNGLP